MAMDGKKVLALVDIDPYEPTPTGSPVYAAVAEQTGLSWETSRNLIETSSKDDDHTKWIYGKQDDTFSLEAAYVPSNKAYQAIKKAQANGDYIILRRSEDGVEVEEAQALISNISGDAPDNDKATVSMEFQLNEAWTAVTP